MGTRWTGRDDEAVREVGWVAREARAIEAEHVAENSERVTEYMSRKRALLQYVEEERMSRA